MTIKPAIIQDGKNILPRHYHNGPVLLTGFSVQTTIEVILSKVNRNFYGGVGEFIIITNGGDHTTQPMLKVRVFNDAIPMLPITPETVGEEYDEVGVGYGQSIMIGTNDNGMDYAYVTFLGPVPEQAPPTPAPKQISVIDATDATEIPLAGADEVFVRATMGVPLKSISFLGAPLDGCTLRLVVRADRSTEAKQELKVSFIGGVTVEGDAVLNFVQTGNETGSGTFNLVYKAENQTFYVM